MDSPAVLPAVVVAEVDCPVTDVLEVGDDAGFDWGEEVGVLEGSVEGFNRLRCGRLGIGSFCWGGDCGRGGS